MVEEEWAKQPYHAAAELTGDEARKLVKSGIDSAFSIATRKMRAAVKREREQKNDIVACAVLVGNPMPEWSVEQILSVHFRMHQAEGVLFRDALVHAARQCKLNVIEVPEKTLLSYAENSLKISSNELSKRLSAIGKLAGPPWGKDQKDAALAAMLAFA
ncbi:MAG TPA: hypothetical protein VFY51_05105 [Pyrinomonadaceae bacterium]|nr:hypothetical protein [Pyrinomonadaceae bacterium]